MGQIIESKRKNKEGVGSTTKSKDIMLENLTKKYEGGDLIAVDSLDLKVEGEEFLTLLGPSGSGKTTTLMMVAGFVKPTAGKIIVGGRDTSYIPPYKRDIGMVFQHYALFPHMSVFDNIAFPLRMRKYSDKEINNKVQEALEMVQLPEYGDRYPDELSGGQQQRVAVARALVFEPVLMLMDEPLGALDKKLREQMQIELTDLHDKLDITVLYVTHDQEEALTMSTRVAVLNGGQLAQVGTPTELYESPESVFVADFIGESNLLEGKITNKEGDIYSVTSEDGLQIQAKNYSTNHEVGESVHIHIRPERIELSPKNEGFENSLEGKINKVIYLGEVTQLHVKVGSGSILHLKHQNDSGPLDVQEGDIINLSWKIDNTSILTS